MMIVFICLLILAVLLFAFFPAVGAALLILSVTSIGYLLVGWKAVVGMIVLFALVALAQEGDKRLNQRKEAQG